MEAPQTLTAAVAMCRDLMRDDPATFHRGWSLENAALAVEEVFGWSQQDLLDELARQDTLAAMTDPDLTQEERDVASERWDHRWET